MNDIFLCNENIKIKKTTNKTEDIDIYNKIKEKKTSTHTITNQHRSHITLLTVNVGRTHTIILDFALGIEVCQSSPHLLVCVSQIVLPHKPSVHTTIPFSAPEH